MTYTDLAQQVGLTGPSVADRVRKLEETGVIRAFVADLDPASLGRGLTAFIAVTLSGDADRQAFLDALEPIHEIVECHHTAGADDYLIKVHTDGTAGLETLISARLRALPGVQRTRSTIVLSTAIDRPVVASP